VSRPPRSTRPEPREVSELRALAERQPELAAAALMQIDLVDAQRRVQSRITTPWIDLTDATTAERLAAGERLVEFDKLPIDWTDVRLLVRQVTDIFRRYEALDAADAARLHELGRDLRLPVLARRWYGPPDDSPAPIEVPEMLHEVFGWALRPVLARMAEVIQQRTTFAGWRRGTCPVCGGQPELGVISASGERNLVCGRCQARWPFPAVACPFCNETSREQLVSFATPEGTYRVTACRTCQRYVKSLDGRHAGRSILPSLDAIATLPLDAVVMQKGFSNG
jgi:hypothetical protein